MSSLYKEIAISLAREIDEGVYEPGDKVPGIRELKLSRKVSVSTAVAAYRQLEEDGYIEARARSGFYVSKRRSVQFAEPSLESLSKRPGLVAEKARVLLLTEQLNKSGVVKLGAAVPDGHFLPGQWLKRVSAELLREQPLSAVLYEDPLGAADLRQQLCKRMKLLRCGCRPQDLIVTSGCQEAVFLALKALTRPGDVVALESPSYHGHIQLLDALGLKAIEIPSDPRKGISLEAFQLAIEQWPVKVCLLIPNFSNPLGSCMSDARKKKLVSLAAEHSVHLIEDDIYGDLDFANKRPLPLKAWDKHNNVTYCSSFSKTLAPGMRIGWLLNSALIEAVEYQKIITNVAVSSLPQHIIARVLQSGRYEKHLRYVRQELQQSMQKMRAAVARYFPRETRMTSPSGGYVLWLELPGNVDAVEVSELMIRKNISVAPGPMFSANGKYQNYMRLSFAVAWNADIEKAIQALGRCIYAKSSAQG